MFTHDRERLHRFEQEARAASALNHPHILTIYEIGQVDDVHFIAMEFIDGETLRQWMASRTVPIGDVLTVTEQVDARTDIWSLGVVLYEMLTGRVPFEGPTPSDVIAAILAREPPPVSHYASEVPEALAGVVTKALAKEREERYQTAREILADVRRLRQQCKGRGGLGTLGPAAIRPWCDSRSKPAGGLSDR